MLWGVLVGACVWEESKACLLQAGCFLQAVLLSHPNILSHMPHSVGNGLGAGSAPLAKLSALAAVITVPPLWVSIVSASAGPCKRMPLVDL